MKKIVIKGNVDGNRVASRILEEQIQDAVQAGAPELRGATSRSGMMKNIVLPAPMYVLRTYRLIRGRPLEVERLTPNDQLKLLEKLAHQLKKTGIAIKKELDWKGLYGLGKGLWKGKDAQEYVNRLREDRV